MADLGDINIEILHWTIESIRLTLGSIEDLPDELANAIANIYYRSGQIVFEDKLRGSAMQSLKDARNIDELVSSYGIGVRILQKLQMTPKLVAGIRSVDKESQPNLYAMTRGVALDILKFDIPNAMNKPEMWRMVERLFRRNEIKEFPNLAELVTRALKATDGPS